MWHYRHNNLLINEKDRLFIHKAELQRLLNIHSTIQNKGPETPFFLKEKLARKEVERVKEKNRLDVNSIIFSRLLKINKTMSKYNRIYAPKYCPAFDRNRHHFDRIEKEKDRKSYNRFLFGRLMEEKTFYPTERFLRINVFENYLKGIIKRQHLDNPNIRFVNFTQFKKKFIKNLRASNNKSVDDKYIDKSYQLSNYKKLFNYKTFNVAKKYDSSKTMSYRNNSMKSKMDKRENLSYSTMLTSRMKNMSKSQSALDIGSQRLKNIS